MAGGQCVRTFALYQRPVASRVCLFASFAAIFFLFHAVLLFSSSPALRRHERHEDLWRNNAPVGNSAWSETPQNKNNCLGLFEFDVMTGARGTTGTNDNQYKGAGACTETTYIATRIAPCSRYEVSVYGSAAATGRVVLLLPPLRVVVLLLSHFGFSKLRPSGNPSRTISALSCGSNGHTPAMCETHIFKNFVAFSKAHSPCGGNSENHSEGLGGSFSGRGRLAK